MDRVRSLINLGPGSNGTESTVVEHGQRVSDRTDSSRSHRRTVYIVGSSQSRQLLTWRSCATTVSHGGAISGEAQWLQLRNGIGSLSEFAIPFRNLLIRHAHVYRHGRHRHPIPVALIESLAVLSVPLLPGPQLKTANLTHLSRILCQPKIPPKNQLPNVDGVPGQGGIRQETQGADLVHDLRVVTSPKRTLIREEESARQLVPRLPSIQLSMHTVSQRVVVAVLQDVGRLQEATGV